jgi:hypothetical protein
VIITLKLVATHATPSPALAAIVSAATAAIGKILDLPEAEAAFNG